MKIKFKDWNCILTKEMYQNNQRVALVLIHETEGDVVAYATVNVPEYPMNNDEVLIKDYSENEGMLQTLVDAGVISEPTGTIQHGFVILYVCKLLM